MSIYRVVVFRDVKAGIPPCRVQLIRVFGSRREKVLCEVSKVMKESSPSSQAYKEDFLDFCERRRAELVFYGASLIMDKNSIVSHKKFLNKIRLSIGTLRKTNKRKTESKKKK